MLVACWSVKGGVGATVVAAGIAAAQASLLRREVVVADLGDDQALVHGVAAVGAAGLRGWTRAGPSVPADALARLEEPIDERRSLLGAGSGPWDPGRAGALAAALAADERVVVADVGRSVLEPVGRAVVEAAERSVLVVRACPLSMRAVAELPVVPDAVVVVRDRNRSLGWREIGERCGAPVAAELDVDPGVGAAIDAGLVARPFPHRFVRALRELA